MSVNIGYIDVYESGKRVPIDALLNKINNSKQNQSLVVKNQWDVEYIFNIDKNEEKTIFIELMNKYTKKIGEAINEIDYIIYCQGDSDCNRLDVAYYIQKKYKIENARVFSINQGCSALVEAINIATKLINNNKNSRILILSSIFTESDEERIVGPTIISDGIGILEITNQSSGIYEILDNHGKTDGEVTEENFFSNSSSAKIVKNGSKLISELVARNNLSLQNIVKIVPLSTCRAVWELHCEMLKYPIENVFLENIRYGGHIGCIDTLRNLKTVFESGSVSKGDFLVCYGISFGTSWDATLLKVVSN